MIHVGIDLHNRNMTFVAINDNRKLLAEEKLTNTPANLERFFGQFNPADSGRLVLRKCVQRSSI